MSLFKLSSFASLAGGVLLLSSTGARAAATALSATGWNVDIIIGQGDSTTGFTGVNASMDQGTTVPAAGSNAFVYYQQGVNAASPTTGVPAAGTVITSSTGSGNTFTLQPYNANNALLLDGGTKTLTLTSPTLLSQLVVYGATGNGSGTDTITVYYANATTQTFSAVTAVGQDWFGGGSNAFTVNGRVNALSGTFDQVGSNNPRIYESALTLTTTTSPVTKIDFTFTGGAAAHNVIYAISGAVIVPEPAGVSLLGLGAAALLRRKRRMA